MGLGSNPSQCQIFLFVPMRSFFLCYPGEAIEGPISTGVCKFNNVDSYNDRQIKKNTILEIESTVDINKKNAVNRTCR